VVEGDLTLAFAQSEIHARYDLAHVAARAAKQADGGYVIDGEKRVVVHGEGADLVVVSARTVGEVADAKGVSVFLVDPKARGTTVRGYRTIDGMRAADIVFDGVRVGADALIGNEGDGLPLIEAVVDFATALVCAEALGVIGYANDATLEYLKTRRQFGVPIGTFQALQHRMVDLFIEHEQPGRWRASRAQRWIRKSTCRTEAYRIGREGSNRRRLSQSEPGIRAVARRDGHER
jgi:alkylation response protein AidB-like acyl-CoA dehydrogenase